MTQGDIQNFLQSGKGPGAGAPSQLPATRPGGAGVGQAPGRPSQLPATRPGAGAPGVATRPAAPGAGLGAAAGAGLGAAAGAGVSQLPANRAGEGVRGQERPGADREAVQRREDRRAERPENLPAEWDDRYDNWQDQADNVRDDFWNNYEDHWDDFYDDHYFAGHYHPYYPYYSHCHDCDWWQCPATWAAVGSFLGSAVSQPPYYTYGSGGTVYVEGDTIVMGEGKQVPIETYTDELIEQAQDIPEGATEETQWMSLGVFTLVDEEAPESTMVLQLALSQKGVIAGMFENSTTQTSVPIEGSADLETSRAVMTPVDKYFPMIETGLYNLVQEQTQALVHFEDGTVEERLLVRLDKPEAAEGGESPAPEPQEK